LIFIILCLHNININNYLLLLYCGRRYGLSGNTVARSCFRLFPLQALAPCALARNIRLGGQRARLGARSSPAAAAAGLQLLPPLSICFVFFFIFSRLVSRSLHIRSVIFTLYCFGRVAVIILTNYDLRRRRRHHLDSREYDKTTLHRPSRVGQIMLLCRITLVNRIFKTPISKPYTLDEQNITIIYFRYWYAVATFLCVRGFCCLVYYLCISFTCVRLSACNWHAITV